ncbi:MAG TPA: GDSL-type esterase/lipase family protein [Bryobacteraceae bacterium]|nr:GDSL-type esterase/lipase family protein [Bryobacteraceae bacterium]
MKKAIHVALVSAVLLAQASAQKTSGPGVGGPWTYDSSSNTLSAPSGSRAAIGTVCPAGAPGGSVCMNGQVLAPVAASALPAASAGNANLIQLVSNTTNCTNSSGTAPMLCISTGTAWVPLGGAGQSSGTSQAGGTSAGLPQANLVAEYTLAEGTGAYSYNYAFATPPSNNLAGPSEQQFSTDLWVHAATSLTDGYSANPNGDWIASRLQATASGGYLAALTGVNYISGQQYTLSIYAASNTGAAQTVRMGDNNVNYSANMVVPASGWTRLAYTFTASGTGNYVLPIVQDAANDPLDISIWGVQLELGPHPTTYVPQAYTMVNGGGAQRAASQCTWIAAGIDCTANSGASYMTAVGWQPIDLFRGTMYAAVKWTGTPVLAGYAPIFSDNYNDPHLYLAGIDSGLPFPRFRFGSLTAYAYATNLNDGNWHIVAGQFDGVNMNLFLDGAQVATYNAGPASPIQVYQLFLSNFADAAYWPGQIGYAALYSVAHTGSQITANMAAIRSIMASRGVTIPAMSQFLAFEGDSITDPTTGVAAASKYYYVAQSGMSPFPQGGNDAVSGSSIATVSSRSTTIDSWFAPITGTKVLFLLVGANDMGDGAAAFTANLKSYCLARKAASPGLKIVLATLLPQTVSGFNTFRDSVNASIHADNSYYDALADFAADATMGCDACAANAAYYPDGEHPSAGGHAILGLIARTAIQSVW